MAANGLDDNVVKTLKAKGHDIAMVKIMWPVLNLKLPEEKT
jgi:hypothetical protein